MNRKSGRAGRRADFLAVYGSTRPRRVWNDFVHDSDELVMLVEGEEEFEMNGQKHRLEIGEELLIPAGTSHTARNVGKMTSKWLYGYKRK